MWLTLLIITACLLTILIAVLAYQWRMGKPEGFSTANGEWSKNNPSVSSHDSQLAALNPSGLTASTPSGFSILIAARNESENLKRFLPSALAQKFKGTYEVIVVLDRCTDDSAQVIADLQTRYPHLRTVAEGDDPPHLRTVAEGDDPPHLRTVAEGDDPPHLRTVAEGDDPPHLRTVAIGDRDLPEGWTGKKHALHLAIQAARYDCLAFTDADCELPPHWLQGIADSFAQGNDLVLGVSPYAPAPSFLNRLIRFETWMTAILYIGLAGLGRPYMGVGRSLAYRKSWFIAAGGFTDIAHRLSGDDDLLVNRAANPNKTGLLTSLQTQVISIPKTTWKAWLRQKIRHGSAAPAYKPASLLILSVIHGLHLIFYISLIVVLCMQVATGWALMIYLLRTVAMTTILATLPWKHKTSILVAFPILDLAYIIYLTLLAPAIAFIQPKWN